MAPKGRQGKDAEVSRPLPCTKRGPVTSQKVSPFSLETLYTRIGGGRREALRFAQLVLTLRGILSPAHAPGVVAPGGSYTEHPGVPMRSIQASSPLGRFLCVASRSSPAI